MFLLAHTYGIHCSSAGHSRYSSFALLAWLQMLYECRSGQCRVEALRANLSRGYFFSLAIENSLFCQSTSRSKLNPCSGSHSKDVRLKGYGIAKQ